MHLLYITFGKKFSTHLEAAFSICTFLRAKQQIRSVNIVTDTPEFYTHLGKNVRLIPVSAAKLEEWEGPHRFFWRIKIKALQQICAQYEGEPVLYLDTDTFFYRDTAFLEGLFKDGQALMHENEGQLRSIRHKTEKRMWKQVKGNSYEGFTLPPDASMWNAGVVGVPNSEKGAECAFALLLCDQMCAEGVTRRLIEQFSLSVALERFYGLKPAANSIAHYWSNKPQWDLRINEFFSEAFFKGLNTEQLIALMGDFDYSSIPVKQYQKNTANRLYRAIGRWFPPRSVQFIEGKTNDSNSSK